MTKKIKQTNNPEIQNLLDMLRNKSLKKFPKDITITHKKFRHIDPEFLDRGKLIKLSMTDNIFKQELLKAREENNKGIQTVLIPK